MERVRIVNKSHHPLPSYETQGSAGMDLRAYISQPIRLNPMERKLIPTGLFLSIPKGFEGQVRPRSGLSIRHGITLINCVGTIDSDYRGEVKIPLINLGQEIFVVEDGMRVAQLVLAAHGTVKWSLEEDLEETSRGVNGFGSTGHI
jgi:dUTP pyrophosphatase